MGIVEIDISMSVDGFITGPDERAAGLGHGGEILHYWFTKDPAASQLLDDALFATSGAVVTSRKVYDGMNGWGETGFYRMAVFVLTHRPHDVVVKGDTTFTFITNGIEAEIAQARAAAGTKKVHIMGGATIAQQALQAGLVDSLHLHVAPVLLGAGTRLFDNLSQPIQLERTEIVESQHASHLRFQIVGQHPAPEPRPRTARQRALHQDEREAHAHGDTSVAWFRDPDGSTFAIEERSIG
jgi:dihydrofolate reductase